MHPIPDIDLNNRSELPAPLRVYMALMVIREWNDSHPIGVNIGVETAGVQEGGTLFTLGAIADSHQPQDIYKAILDRLTTDQQTELLDLLDIALQARRHQLEQGGVRGQLGVSR